MTTLLVQQLKAGKTLSHNGRFNLDVRIPIAAMYPYLYMHGAPAGTFTFAVIRDAITLYSHSFTSSDIKAALGTSNNFARVMYPIIPQNPIQFEKGLITFQLSSTGYTPNYSSLLGWIQEHENLINEMDYTPLFDNQNPLCLKLKRYKEGITI